jgi:hypothetical protein
MTPEAWTFFTILTGGVGGIFNEAIKTRRELREVKLGIGVVGDKADAANESATDAADLSRPTGNGYAKNVLSALSDLKEGQRILHDEITENSKAFTDHLRDHVQEGMNLKNDKHRD